MHKTLYTWHCQKQRLLDHTSPHLNGLKQNFQFSYLEASKILYKCYNINRLLHRSWRQCCTSKPSDLLDMTQRYTTVLNKARTPSTFIHVTQIAAHKIAAHKSCQICKMQRKSSTRRSMQVFNSLEFLLPQEWLPHVSTLLGLRSLLTIVGAWKALYRKGHTCQPGMLCLVL